MGVIRFLQFLHRRQIVILMIHGVMDDKDDPLWKPLRPRLSRDTLDKYLTVLSKRYRFVSLMDAVEMLQGRKPMQPYSMVLTFDDGYRNNITHALPILQRHKAPATFFVPTGFVDNPRPFWFDRLDYALQQAPVDGREVRVGSFAMRLDASSREALAASYKRLRRTAKKLHVADDEFLQHMQQFAARLEAESNRALSDMQKEDDWSAIMTWEQIRQVTDDGVPIGSHTADHVRLGLVTQDVARDQLVRSKRDIENHTIKPCVSLCYPNGSFNEEIVNVARQSGYVCGLTTEEGLNRVGDDTMMLKRMALEPDFTDTGLLARVSAAFAGLRDMKHELLYWRRGLGTLQKIPIHIYQLVRGRGLRKGVMRICDELYSEREWLVTKHDLNSQVEIESPDLQLSIREVTEHNMRDIERICHVWPPEFGYWRADYLKSKFIRRLDNGDWCFCACVNGDLVGGVWLHKSDLTAANCGVCHHPGERVVRSLFVVPEARGKGIGKALLNHACKVAKDRRIPQLLSLVFRHRESSIRAHISLGFKIVGAIKVTTRLGKSRYKFTGEAELSVQNGNPAGTDQIFNS
jgi:peptidoglycan/xylan/chitin deacetylase (PgdA/CDA1 family)/GNAT superfamily N-acetyltransferase